MSDPNEPDHTRRIDPDVTRRHDPDATRQVDPDATRRADGPGAGAGAEQQHTQRIAPVAGAATGAGAWEGTADPHRPPEDDWHDDAGEPVDAAADEPDRDRRRDLAFGAGGLLLGFLLAFLIIALGTSDRGDGEVAAADERVEELEFELEERDARIGALEAQVAEAEAAAGESDADIEAQRQALEERSQALDDRVDRIDERSLALDRREAELDEREQTLAEREQQADEPADGDGDADPDGENGGLLPDLDTDEVETFIDRILERIRDLF
jgi:hypothetical protein